MDPPSLDVSRHHTPIADGHRRSYAERQPVPAHLRPTARAAATCADYPDEAAAQRVADTRDTDGDGLYCVISSEVVVRSACGW